MNEKELENKKIVDSFELTLTNNILDVEKTITGLHAIEEFYKTELIYWEEIANSGSIVQYYIQYISYCLQQLQTILNNYKDWDTPTINNHWTSFQGQASLLHQNNPNYIYFFSTIPQAAFLKQLYHSDTSIGVSAHMYLLNLQANLNDKKNFIGYLKAFIFDLQSDKEIFSRKKYEQKAFNKLSEVWNSKTNEMSKEFDILSIELNEQKNNFIDSLEEWNQKFIDTTEAWNSEKRKNIDDFISQKDRRLNELEELYTKKLQLEGPVIYWQKQAQKFRSNGIIWASLLTIVILLSSIILFSVLYNLPDAFHFKISNGDPEAIRGAIVYITIISFFAYMVKTFSKLTFSSFHLQRDAEEREQLTFVYLALLEKGAVSRDERELILQSLFSRSDTGLLSGENNISMPGVQNIFDQFRAR